MLKNPQKPEKFWKMFILGEQNQYTINNKAPSAFMLSSFATAWNKRCDVQNYIYLTQQCNAAKEKKNIICYAHITGKFVWFTFYRRIDKIMKHNWIWCQSSEKNTKNTKKNAPPTATSAKNGQSQKVMGEMTMHYLWLNRILNIVTSFSLTEYEIIVSLIFGK